MIRSSLLVFTPILSVFFTFSSGLSAWTPGTGNPNATDGFIVNPTDRTDVLAFYHTIYGASENYASKIAWTGSVAGGVVGTTSAAFKDDVLRRINFYRALVALPADITLDATKSAKDQEAALMFARNGSISHTPPTGWTYYTANASEAAGISNIAIGTYGPASVDAYMQETGSNNTVVGHRRWLVYSRAKIMGTGDVPSQSPYSSTNAIWVIGNFKPAPAPQFVAWPNRGYVPLKLVSNRWSLSYPGADFSTATVTMTQAGNNVLTDIISSVDDGYGDNTIVWEPDGLPVSINADLTYQVTVSGIGGFGVPTSYTYTVTLFDPNVLNDSPTIAGSNTPATTGAAYTFSSTAQADAYELRVTTTSTAPWTDGAEDPSSQIVPATTGSYALRQSSVVRTGAKAFQLVFPSFDDQSFVIARDVTPSAASNLQFYDLARFSTITSTLDAEISTDYGGTWMSLWSRNGVGLSSTLWDSSFKTRNISLAAYAGQVVRIRFIIRRNNQSITTGTTSNHGFFIDDVTITNSTQLANGTTTPLAANTTSFTLDTATAGAPLAANAVFYLQVRPNVGTRWFAYGPPKIVTAEAPAGYAGWVATQYPAVTGGPTADDDHDGLSNAVEYAFGLNPLTSTPSSALPQPTVNGNNFSATFTQPAGVTGVTYGAQWSRNLTAWGPVTDSGSGENHSFSVNTLGETEVFFRYKVIIDP